MAHVRHPLTALRALMLVALAVALLAGTGIAAADEAADRGEASLTVLKPRRGSGTDVFTVSARLADAEGRPVGNREVQFSVVADFFGRRPVKVGAALTDATGTATVAYEPIWEGQQEIMASFAGDSAYGPAEGTTVLDAPAVAPAHAEEPLGLEPVRGWAVPAAGLAAAAVWGLLAFVALRTMVGIARADGVRAEGVEPAPVASGQRTRPEAG